MTLSDEETVLQIQENPYLQLFVGLATYKDEQPFAASLFVEIRKRMGKEIFSAFEQVILDKIDKKKSKLAETPTHQGKMLVDTTVAEQALRFPTDIILLNEARETSEALIDDLYKLSDYDLKSRTYRLKARRATTILTT